MTVMLTAMPTMGLLTKSFQILPGSGRPSGMRSAPLVRSTRRSCGGRRGGHASRFPLRGALGRQAAKHFHEGPMLHGEHPLGQLLGARLRAGPAPRPARIGGRRPAPGVTSCTVTPVTPSPAASTARWTASPTIPRPPCRAAGWVDVDGPSAEGREVRRSQQLVIAGQQGKFRAESAIAAPMAWSRASALANAARVSTRLGTLMGGGDRQGRHAGPVADDQDRLDVGQPLVGDGIEHRPQVRAAAGDEHGQAASGQASSLRGRRRAARRTRPAPRSRPAPPRATRASPRPGARGERPRSGRSPG